MRRKSELEEQAETCFELVWYARHMLGNGGKPEPDHPGVPAQRKIEDKYPALTARRYWLDGYEVARLEGQMGALRWALWPKDHDEPLLTGSETGLYDS